MCDPSGPRRSVQCHFTCGPERCVTECTSVLELSPPARSYRRSARHLDPRYYRSFAAQTSVLSSSDLLVVSVEHQNVDGSSDSLSSCYLDMENRDNMHQEEREAQPLPPLVAEAQPGRVAANGGHYDGWTPDKFYLRLDLYIALTVMVDCLSTIRWSNFSIKAMRDECLQKIRALPKARIVGPAKRFPDDDLYVNVSRGTYADLLDKICSSLDFGEKYTMAEATTTAKGQNTGTLDDAKLACSRGIQRALEIIGSPNLSALATYGVFSTESFEDFNKLTWVYE